MRRRTDRRLPQARTPWSRAASLRTALPESLPDKKSLSPWSGSGVQVGNGFFRRRIGAVLGKSHRIVERIFDALIDFLLLFRSQDAHVLEVGRKGGQRIAALPHGELFLGAVEGLVVL